MDLNIRCQTKDDDEEEEEKEEEEEEHSSTPMCEYTYIFKNIFVLKFY